MPMRKREEIQALLRSKIALLLILSSCVIGAGGFGIYAYSSPSLPIAEDWIDHVAAYPIFESGLAIEFPGPSALRFRVEGNYAPFPNSGVIENGDAMWISAGALIRKNLANSVSVNLGPQFSLGMVRAEGLYNLIEGDTASYIIEFDGSGSGFGIGIIGGIDIELSNHLRLGVQATVVYFSVKGEEVPITGYSDIFDPESTPDYSTIIYEGEYIAFSPRVVIGYEF